jgi:hypothetical protein
VSLAQHVGQVLRPARQAGAELRDDQAEALAVRAAHHVQHEVGRDRRRRLVDRDRVVAQALLRAARLTVDEVLADQRLLADVAGGVGAERVEARLGDLGLDHRARPRDALRGRPLALALGALGDTELLGHAGLDTADTEVAALGEAEDVVERDPDRPLALLLVGAGQDDRGEAGRNQDEDGCQAADHGLIGPVARS